MSSEVIFLSEVSHWKSQFQEVTVRRNKNLLDEVKNIAGQVLTYNSKNFHWLNRKLDLERIMNGLVKPLKKNPIQKNEKTVKINVKLPHVNKKPLARKRIFVQTQFSHSALNLERKKIHAAKPLAFSIHFLFRRDQNLGNDSKRLEGENCPYYWLHN